MQTSGNPIIIDGKMNDIVLIHTPVSTTGLLPSVVPVVATKRSFDVMASASDSSSSASSVPIVEPTIKRNRTSDANVRDTEMQVKFCAQHLEYLKSLQDHEMKYDQKFLDLEKKAALYRQRVLDWTCIAKNNIKASLDLFIVKNVEDIESLKQLCERSMSTIADKCSNDVAFLVKTFQSKIFDLSLKNFDLEAKVLELKADKILDIKND
jgi:hypothetical protein